MELADNTTVTTLILNKNDIRHQGCVDIANAFNKNRILMSIELNNNSIGDDGCSAMATMLRENMVLTKILLNGNRIGLAGAMALAETLRINATLRELGLGWNNVGNEGAAAIAGALRCKEALQRLDLSSNSIGDEGTKAILKALTESNSSLTSLNLEDNDDMSPVLQYHFDFALTSRRVLKSFRICLCKPLDKKLMPLVIHGLQSQDTTAGPIFLLVRAAALLDSKVIKAVSPSLKRKRMPDV
jgi:Leucine Rich repeat